MARPKTHVFWRERVGVLAEQGLSQRAIYHRLEEEGKQLGKDDWPGETTVRRIYKEHTARPAAERHQYGLFYWPDAMERGDLPWEASPVVLGLLRHFQDKGLERPTMRLTKWYFRVCSATVESDGDRPDGETIDVEMRLLLAALLASFETLQTHTGEPVDRIPVEHMLTYRPWRSERDYTAYETAMRRAGYTGPNAPFDWLVSVIGSSSMDVLSIVFQEMSELFAWSNDSDTLYRSMAERAGAWSKTTNTSEYNES